MVVVVLRYFTFCVCASNYGYTWRTVGQHINQAVDFAKIVNVIFNDSVTEFVE